MIKSARDKWARGCQQKLVNMATETDSCAAIDGARMSTADRKEMRELCIKVAELLSKY